MFELCRLKEVDTPIDFKSRGVLRREDLDIVLELVEKSRVRQNVFKPSSREDRISITVV